jgi:hypothetical protein
LSDPTPGRSSGCSSDQRGQRRAVILEFYRTAVDIETESRKCLRSRRSL